MKLENQVCSLELAKRFKELGVKQESLFWWVAEDTVKQGRLYHATFVRPDLPNIIRKEINLHAAAFTVAELGEMLSRKWAWYSFPGLIENAWGCRLIENDFTTHANTEADARAKMLIYLLENKLTSL